MDTTKICKGCKEEKAIDDYYKQKGNTDGLFGRCKKCVKRRVRNHRRNSPRPREYDAERYQNDPVRRQRIIDAAARRRKENPKQTKAQTAVSNAVRDGRLTRPEKCSRCGDKSRRIEGHHPDYDKPLDVVWVCPPCHRILDGCTGEQ